MPLKILVCTDGEPHSEAAIRYAIRLGRSLPADVTGLHVIDPWLKKFQEELYAQGRRVYLEYVDERLQDDADRTRRAFERTCRSAGIEAGFRVRRGEPFEEIIEELREAKPDLLITGGKRLNAWGRFRSGRLPSRLRQEAGAAIPVLSVPAPTANHASGFR